MLSVAYGRQKLTTSFLRGMLLGSAICLVVLTYLLVDRQFRQNPSVLAQSSSCPYTSTQVRVQRHEQDPWSNQETITLGESVRLGGFHNGTGRFAGDPNNTYTPNVADIEFHLEEPAGGAVVTISPPYPAIFSPTNIGTYTFVGRTQRQANNPQAGYYTEVNCTDSAVVEVGVLASAQSAHEASPYPTPVATPSPSPAAQTHALTAFLIGSQEVPPTGSLAVGVVNITYNDGTNSLLLEAYVVGISPMELTGAHIHRGAVGINGDIIVDLGPPTEWRQQFGLLRRSFTGTLPEAEEEKFLSGLTYVNLHTDEFPAGEIRGQIRPGIGIIPSPPAESSPQPTPMVTPAPSPTPSAELETELKMCKFEDDNANGKRDVGDRVLSWGFIVRQGGETRTVESHWWNPFTQGCVLIPIRLGQDVVVSEVERSGWRLTQLYVDGVPVSQSSYSYTPHVDEIKILWFLNTFTPTGGEGPAATPSPGPSVSPTPTPSSTPTSNPTPTPIPTPTPSPSPSATPPTGGQVTTNTQPECVSLSANPTFGGATLTVSFIGKSRDLDGIIRQMEFNFGEGASQIVDVSGETNRETLATVSHLYRQAGIFNASLRVKDNSGQSNEWSTTPESCKVRIDVQGTVLGGTTTTTVTQLPKAGVSEGMTLGYLTSGIVGWGLMKLAKKLRELS